MGVEVTLHPNFNNREPQVVRNKICYYHDIIVGALIMARNNYKDNGARIYKVNDFPKHSDFITQSLLFDMANQANLHTELMPYMKVSLPVHLDDGRLIDLKFAHFPSVIAVQTQRMSSE
jgi:hypothetical protein